MPLKCHALTLNTIELQLSDAVADISMLQCSAIFRNLFINAHFVADNASHALASSATVRPTLNVEEEVVVIRNGSIPKGGEAMITVPKKLIIVNPQSYEKLHNFVIIIIV